MGYITWEVLEPTAASSSLGFPTRPRVTVNRVGFIRPAGVSIRSGAAPFQRRWVSIERRRPLIQGESARDAMAYVLGREKGQER
jgi:hypothetical protein